MCLSILLSFFIVLESCNLGTALRSAASITQSFPVNPIDKAPLLTASKA
jgi:hypothetical protein